MAEQAKQKDPLLSEFQLADQSEQTLYDKQQFPDGEKRREIPS
jgi:hypothetical protein